MLIIFAGLIFVVIYYSQFQVAAKLCCYKTSLQLNFRVYNFRSFLQLQIITNSENSKIPVGGERKRMVVLSIFMAKGSF